MGKAGKGLLFRLSDIPVTTLESMHTGNPCHLVPKPDSPEGRFIIDASNVSEGRVPLNGTTAKEQAILRYAYRTFEGFSLGGMNIVAAGSFNGLIFSFSKRILRVASIIFDGVRGHQSCWRPW